MHSTRENYARPDDIAAILAMKRIAVVGLSSDRGRPSNGVAQYMQRMGYEIIPVNPSEQEILGRKAYSSLSEIPEAPEVVDVFRRPEHVSAIVDEAIKIGAKAIWLQLGVVDEDAARRAREAGLIVVMDRCIKVDHSLSGA